jgi:regulator of sigma E protease
MAVVYFLLLVGVLVVIHEFGHFLAAKLLDFKVLRFSIGFGRPLIRIKARETEYQIAIIPFGGYVRILGEDTGDVLSPADARRSFAGKPIWQRLIVVFAGPAANLLLPVVIYFVFFAGHTELPAAVIGDVLEDGPAARAGIEPGDRVLAVDGTSIRYWEELETRVQSSIGRELHVVLQRGDREIEKYIVPVEETVRRRDGTSKRRGRIGVTHAPFLPFVGVLDRTSPAGQANLRTGDLIISIDGAPVDSWSKVQRKLAGAERSSVVYFRGTEVPGLPQVKLLAPHFAALVPDVAISSTLQRTTYTGLERAEMFVAHIEPGSPADLAGLRPGDLITSLDRQPVPHWMELDQRLQSEPGRAWTVGWQRTGPDGRVLEMSAEVTQVKKSRVDEYGHSVERLVFGARNDAERGRGKVVPIEGRFAYAISRAVERTGETIGTMTSGFWAILGGNAPSDAVGGPLTMFRVASVSGERGWESFLLMLALISVNLGLINLLPIPVLDGGHLLLFAVEAVRRKPLSTKTRERIQFGGLAFVGIITILALRNDVMRFIIR